MFFCRLSISVNILPKQLNLSFQKYNERPLELTNNIGKTIISYIFDTLPGNKFHQLVILLAGFLEQSEGTLHLQ